MPKPLLVKQIIPVSAQAFALGGSPLTFNIPRESVIEKISVAVEGNITTGAATANVDGLPALLQSLSVTGSLQNGRFEPVVALSGPDLYEAAQFHRGTLPHSFGALGSTGRFRVEIPLYFREYFWGDEFKNLLPAIPAWQMSELTLTVTPATQAQVDSNATPTLVIAAGSTVQVEVHQYFRESVPADLKFFRGTWEVQVDSVPTTASPYEVRLPAGGDYTQILLRAFSAANTRQAQTGTSGPLTYPNGYIRLFELSRTVKIDTDPGKVRAMNLEAVVDTLVAGNYALLFNRFGPNQVFQTGAIGQALNNVTMHLNTTTGTGNSIRFVNRRIFDPENFLGIVR